MAEIARWPAGAVWGGAEAVGRAAGGSGRLIARGARSVGREFGGIVEDARQVGRPSSPAKSDMDDVTLARKVESEIFRGRPKLKAEVNVNAVDGVVWLRGEVKRPDQVRALVAKAEAVPEVRRVENLLHLAKTPAPTRADTPKRQQRTRSSTRRPTPRRTAGRLTDDRTSAIVDEAEPTPAAHEQAGEGRTPAPMGSVDTAGTEGSGSSNA